MALSVSLSLGSKTPSHSIEGQVGEVDSLAPFQGANAIPCPLGMDIEYSEGWLRGGGCPAKKAAYWLCAHPTRPDYHGLGNTHATHFSCWRMPIYIEASAVSVVT
jgi:hypothetical protein